MVVACLALLVALGGTSIAAVRLPRGSVGTLQLRTGAVTNAKVANNAVTSVKVRNRSLLRADFAPGQLPAGPVWTARPGRPGGTGRAGRRGWGARAGQQRHGAPGVRGRSGILGGRRSGWSERVLGHPQRDGAVQLQRAGDVGGDGLECTRQRPRARDRVHDACRGEQWCSHRVHGTGANNARDGQAHTFTLYVLCYQVS